ncbi:MULTISPECIES: hypothetical protein [unclassified Microcoleus]|uniref:hypothetical protein n=1 Tax=unclassified Microcoleus TaxID=2642155 RepID=UPI002FD2DFCE
MEGVWRAIDRRIDRRIDPRLQKIIIEYKCLQLRRGQSIARRLSLSFGVGLSNILW